MFVKKCYELCRVISVAGVTLSVELSSPIMEDSTVAGFLCVELLSITGGLERDSVIGISFINVSASNATEGKVLAYR